MKKFTLLFTLVLVYLVSQSQIIPTDSPYYNFGTYTVVMDSNMTTSPDILIFRPSHSNDGPYPTVLFQPGANSGTAYITKHSYNIYWEHLASYGYVVIIMNNTQGGPNANIFKNMHNWIKTQVNAGGNWLSEYIDLNRFIVAGHSNGGMNATDIIIDRRNEIHAIVYMASYPNPGFLGMGAQNVSNYNGKVLLMCGSEDDTSVPLVGTTNEVAKTAYNSKFSSANCKTWALFNGVGHGGFGDYGNPAQPVGSIGREPTTASIRHILVSFLNSQFKYDEIAFNNLNTAALRPNSLGEFLNTCQQVVGVESIAGGYNVSVYPNPAKDKLVLDNLGDNKLNISIFDMQGRLIKVINTNGDNSVNIDINDIENGMYIINIFGFDINNSFRFTKF